MSSPTSTRNYTTLFDDLSIFTTTSLGDESNSSHSPSSSCGNALCSGLIYNTECVQSLRPRLGASSAVDGRCVREHEITTVQTGYLEHCTPPRNISITSSLMKESEDLLTDDISLTDLIEKIEDDLEMSWSPRKNQHVSTTKNVSTKVMAKEWDEWKTQTDSGWYSHRQFMKNVNMSANSDKIRKEGTDILSCQSSTMTSVQIKCPTKVQQQRQDLQNPRQIYFGDSLMDEHRHSSMNNWDSNVSNRRKSVKRGLKLRNSNIPLGGIHEMERDTCKHVTIGRETGKIYLKN